MAKFSIVPAIDTVQISREGGSRERRCDRSETRYVWGHQDSEHRRNKKAQQLQERSLEIKRFERWAARARARGKRGGGEGVTGQPLQGSPSGLIYILVTSSLPSTTVQGQWSCCIVNLAPASTQRHRELHEVPWTSLPLRSGGPRL